MFCDITKNVYHMIKYTIQMAKVNEIDDRVPNVKKYEHMQVLHKDVVQQLQWEWYT
jgi:hypothetical protein